MRGGGSLTGGLCVATLAELSGWLLPDGRFVAAAEWWHLNALYELRDGGDSCMDSAALLEELRRGDEDAIKLQAARSGFVKCSKHGIDGMRLTDAQLVTLQGLLGLCAPDEEVQVFHTEGGALRRMSVQRLLKLRRAELVYTHS